MSSAPIRFVPFSFVKLCQVVGKQTGDAAEHISVLGVVGSGEAVAFLKLLMCGGNASRDT